MVGYSRDPRTGLVTFLRTPLFTIKVKVERERDLLTLFQKLGRPIEQSFKRKDIFVVEFRSSMSLPAIERIIRAGLEGGDEMFLELDSSIANLPP